MIAIIDYGVGNLVSAEKAFVALGADVRVTSDESTIREASKIVLPGVGAFGDCMKNLEESGLIPVLKESVAAGKPLLGICVGLQVLFDGSEESPGAKGLGLIHGMVKKIQAPGLKVPHMGWNDLILDRPHPVLEGIATGDHAYFVHSYHFRVADPAHRLAFCTYGGEITAIVGRDNILGTQFHPEKSQSTGLRLIGNFLRWKP